MPKDVEMVPGFTELIDLSKRVANAASQLARVRETDVEIAQTSREEILSHRGARTVPDRSGSSAPRTDSGTRVVRDGRALECSRPAG